MELKKGDRINWARASRGGHGCAAMVPGVFVKEGPKRVQIQICERTLHDKHWMPRVRWVDKASVTPRLLPSAVLDEEMSIEVNGFLLSFWKHPNGVSRGFPGGIFYGTIDGYQVGGPWTSPELAVHAAYHTLMRGGYDVALRSAIECFEGWLKQGVDGALLAKAEADIPALQARLQKVMDATSDIQGSGPMGRGSVPLA